MTVYSVALRVAALQLCLDLLWAWHLAVNIYLHVCLKGVFKRNICYIYNNRIKVIIKLSRFSMMYSIEYVGYSVYLDRTEFLVRFSSLGARERGAHGHGRARFNGNRQT